MATSVLIAGGGIGGLAAALACSRVGCRVSLFERAPSFLEVGAGIQVSPNVVRVLDSWGLASALKAVAAFPGRLQARDAVSGDELGVLSLGESAVQRYGFPYATVHRADLHSLLLSAVKQNLGATLRCGASVESLAQDAAGVTLDITDRAGVSVQERGDVLVGADGLWSSVRQWLLNDGAARASGHVAYRAIVSQAALPQALRSQHITAWLGPKLHAVQYPVRGGEWLNVVVILEGPPTETLDNWDQSANARSLQSALARTCAPLQDLVAGIEAWRLWALCGRPPMRSAAEHVLGRVALLGDAAHPMFPYLAQGAGMAIEDAATLAHCLAPEAGGADDLPMQLQRYAGLRWRRNARVQQRAIRNGQIFHATGVTAWGRDMSMKLLGQRLLDIPWLYGHDAVHSTGVSA